MSRMGGRGGSGSTLDPAMWFSPLGKMEAADVLLTRLQERDGVPMPLGGTDWEMRSPSSVYIHAYKYTHINIHLLSFQHTCSSHYDGCSPLCHLYWDLLLCELSSQGNKYVCMHWWWTDTQHGACELPIALS